jgi:hypothetical protein
MSKTDMVRAYTESLLKQVLSTDNVVTDDDGDYPVRFNSALYYVRIDSGSNDHPVVQIFAIALAGIDAGPELFERLNGINTRLRFARCFWVANQVLFESEMVGEELSLVGLRQACETVGGAADFFGKQLADEFGGKTAFADEKAEEYEPPVESRLPGLYL